MPESSILKSGHKMSGLLTNLYNGVNVATNVVAHRGLLAETDKVAKTSWSEIFRQVKQDASARFRDLPGIRSFYQPSGTSDDVVKFLEKAIADKRIAETQKVMGQDQLYYMTSMLPGGGALFYYMNLLLNVYSNEEKAKPGVMFETLGIERPVATVIDDKVEKMFLLYLYACIENESNVPLPPHEKRGAGKWRRWVRHKLDMFLCADYGVSVKMREGAC